MKPRILLTSLLLALPCPAATNFLFIHHSVGDGWLNAGQLAAQLTALGYQVNDATYGDAVGGPNAFGLNPLGDYTDVCHWYWWFNHTMDATLAWDCAAGESNRFVMFKSCFPNSVIYEDGVAPGDPTNDTHSTWNHKAAYLSLTNAFAARSNTLFIAVTAPPVKRRDGYEPANAARCRAFHDWLRNDYVAAYRAATGLRNLAVFDLFDILATPATAPRNANALLQRYCTRDSHPNERGSRAATGAFLPFLRDTLVYEAGGAAASNRYLVGVQAKFNATTRKCTLKAYLDSATGAAAGEARVWLGTTLVQTFPAAAWKNGKNAIKNPDGTKAWLKILTKAPPQLQLQVVLPAVPAGPLPLRVELGNGAVYVVDLL
jgi:hypothetical protein